MAVALALSLALGRSSLQSEVWASQAVVRVLNASSTSLLPDQSRIDPVREVEIQTLYANSGAIKDAVNAHFGPEAVRIESVTITGLPTADAIQFSVNSGSRLVAQQAAQDYADVYVEFRRRDLAELTKAQTEKLDQESAEIKDQIAAIDKRLSEIAPQVVFDLRGAPLQPPESEESKGLRANRVAFATRLADAEKQLEQLDMDSSVRQGAIAVVAPAERPTDPVQPTPFRDAAVAIALGLFVGLAIAVARASFDDRIRVSDDLEEMVPEGVGAVSIPFNANHAKKGREVVLAVEDRRSPELEAYRALRTTLLFGRHGEEPARRVLVTSPNQGEGKTTISANLAVTMARSGRRVVLVDCDLRRPRVHAVFDLPNDVGLVSVVRDGSSLKDALKSVDLPDSQQLHLLTAGPVSSNPAELLMGRTVTAIIDKLAERYDCVIIDTSPLRAVADALPLANQVDGVILIARAGATRRRDISEALMQLDLVSADLLAVAVSQVHKKDGQYGSYYGYYGPAPGPGQRVVDGDGVGTTSTGVMLPAREYRGPSKTKS